MKNSRRPFRGVGLLLLRLDWFKRLRADGVRPQLPHRTPSVRFVVGVGIVGASYVLGWPAMGVLGWISLYSDAPWLIQMVLPAVYVFSWILLGVGVLLAGREAVPYVRSMVRWWFGLVLEKMLGESRRSAAPTDVDGDTGASRRGDEPVGGETLPTSLP